MAWVTSAHVTADFPTAHDPTVGMRHASPCARFFICTAVVWYRMSYTNMTFARAIECIRVRSLFVRICVARRTIELVRRTLRRCRIGRLITRARNANTHTHACTRTQYTARRWRHQPAVDAAPAAATAAANERVARARLYLESRTQRISWPLLFGSACCARPIHARPSEFLFSCPLLCILNAFKRKIQCWSEHWRSSIDYECVTVGDATAAFVDEEEHGVFTYCEYQVMLYIYIWRYICAQIERAMRLGSQFKLERQKRIFLFDPTLARVTCMRVCMACVCMNWIYSRQCGEDDRRRPISDSKKKIKNSRK